VEDLSDIQFYDSEKYFLEVKSLLFFKQKGILDRFEKVTREFYDIVSSSPRKFYLGFGKDREPEIIHKKSIFNPFGMDSSSIFMYNKNFLRQVVVNRFNLRRV